MSNRKKMFLDVLRGKFLVDEGAMQSWGFILFVTALALLMISSSHQIDKKIQEIALLNRDKRELRSRYVATKSDLMKLKMESSISRKIEENGLFVSQTPPHKIKVSIKE